MPGNTAPRRAATGGPAGNAGTRRTGPTAASTQTRSHAPARAAAQAGPGPA